MLRNFFIFTALFFLTSCIFLSRSDLVNFNNKDETISVISVKIIYEGKPENRDHGIMGFCQLRFHDDNIEPIKFRHEEGTSYYVLKSESGKIMADQLSCLHHIIPIFYLKHRRFDLTNWAFWAHRNYINYLGHITITYKPSGFGLHDVFGLGGTKYDDNGKLEIRSEDRIDDAISFINSNYPEFKGIPFTKSFLDDIAKINPATKPETYVPGAVKAVEVTKPVETVAPAATKPEPTKPNPYYTPYQSETTPYINPYQKPVQPLIAPVETQN